MEIKINTTKPQRLTSDEADAIANAYVGTKLTLADTGVPTRELSEDSDLSTVEVQMTDGIYGDTKESLEGLGVTVNTPKMYQRILDPEVKRVLLENVSHAEEGRFAEAEFKGITSIPSFRGNTFIKSFNEFVKTNVNSILLQFYGCSSLEEISLPITTIPRINTDVGNQHFGGCSSLVKVYAPNLTHISDNYNYQKGSFNYLQSLREVQFPKIKIIGQHTFIGCTNLVRFNTNKDGWADLRSVTHLDRDGLFTPGYCFKGCKGLTRFILPDTPPVACGATNSFNLATQCFVVRTQDIKDIYLANDYWKVFDESRFIVDPSVFE